MADRKVIITVAPTGGFQGKEANPNIPLQPSEISETAYDCWNAGASIVHIHARDTVGKPTADPIVYSDILNRIRGKGCEIITQVTTGGGPGMTTEERLQPIYADPKPEMASLDLGPMIVTWAGREWPDLFTRSVNEWYAKEMLARDIKPEIEAFSNIMMLDVPYLIEKGLVKKPYVINFVMGMHRVAQGAIPFSPKNLLLMMDMLPPDSMFNVMGIGPDQLTATTMAVLLGGNMRVGFEDNVYYSHGVLAKSNAQLVERAVRIIREMNCEPATPDESRQMLGLAPLHQG
ncbi:MAG: 3-keto-5-aminohexanoate cleavage protein [Chloroflexota bacterium]|nr:MAG: 3-keto-5-aminohexanoate cleavage protein [Chloroflexota bacterium]